MKKKIDISSVASSLRGESVFFPTKNGKPAPELAGEPIENKASASLLANQQTSKEVNQQVSKEANAQINKEVKKQTTLLANQQASKSLKKFGSYLTEESLKGLKRIAFEADRKDYDILQEAVDQYLERNKK